MAFLPPGLGFCLLRTLIQSLCLVSVPGLSDPGWPWECPLTDPEERGLRGRASVGVRSCTTGRHNNSPTLPLGAAPRTGLPSWRCPLTRDMHSEGWDCGRGKGTLHPVLPAWLSFCPVSGPAPTLHLPGRQRVDSRGPGTGPPAQQVASSENPRGCWWPPVQSGWRGASLPQPHLLP